jgi:malonyl-CoA O-methyltransferase
MMVEAGLADPVMDQETLRLTWATPKALLAELRGLGANAAPDRCTGLRTPRWHQRLLGALAEHAGPDGRITLEFELVYGHAYQKPDPGPRVAAHTEIGLTEMRSLLRRKPGV